MPPWFEDRAADWIRFARAEGHDAYWTYRDAFFALLPAPPARTLEVGCGEGRVSRDLGARGYDIVGIDVAPSLVDAARDADRDGAYVVGDAAALPFGDASFDLVASYNSLIDVEDMPAAVTEASRVLRPGGCFCACVPHPFSDAGEFTSDDADAAFVVEGSYLHEDDYELVSKRNGIVFHFASRRFPLESYARALESAGLAIESLREPSLPGATRHRRARMPLFLLWRAVKLEGRA
ncbi:MAG TPA: class I SAM-dependent methyltransferase [Gaiella sp.]